MTLSCDFTPLLNIQPVYQLSTETPETNQRSEAYYKMNLRKRNQLDFTMNIFYSAKGNADLTFTMIPTYKENSIILLNGKSNVMDPTVTFMKKRGKIMTC